MNCTIRQKQAREPTDTILQASFLRESWHARRSLQGSGRQLYGQRGGKTSLLYPTKTIITSFIATESDYRVDRPRSQIMPTLRETKYKIAGKMPLQANPLSRTARLCRTLTCKTSQRTPARCRNRRAGCKAASASSLRLRCPEAAQPGQSPRPSRARDTRACAESPAGPHIWPTSGKHRSGCLLKAQGGETRAG